MIRFPIIQLTDTNDSSDAFLLGTDNHHSLMINEHKSMDFRNLQNGETTGDGNYAFLVEPDNDDYLPLVSFAELMQAVRENLTLDPETAKKFEQAVTTIDDIIYHADQEDTEKFDQMKNDTVGDYLNQILKFKKKG